MKNLKRTLASVLALIMTVTMFAASVSAEEAVTEDETEEVVDTSYTWTLYKDYVAPTSVTTTADPVITTVDSAEAPTAGTTYSQSTINNNDGTATHTLTKTVIAVADNGDGTTEVTTTVTDTVTVYDLMQENNPAIDLKIYSSRVNAIGFLNCNTFEANTIVNSNSTSYRSTTNPDLSKNDGYKINIDNIEYDNGRYGFVYNNGNGSFYIGTEDASARERLMYLARPYNDMWVEFTAPTDGIYTAQGYISQHTHNNYPTDVTYNYVKIDSNGNQINLTAELPIAVNSTATLAEKDMVDVKVELKKGEKLALTTFTSAAVNKIFLDSYAITKLDYTEAVDKSTVTTNYYYKNYNYEKIYGDTFATSLSKNYENVWDMNAVRFFNTNSSNVVVPASGITLNGTTDLDKYADGILVNGSTAWCENTTINNGNNSYIEYNSTEDTLVARTSNRRCNGVIYNYGFQFIFTVPEDGDAVITVPAYISGGNMAVRRGVLKAGSTDVVYEAPLTSTGIAQMWETLKADPKIYNMTDLKAGDKIYIEVVNDNTSYGSNRLCNLNTLSVALTTESSPVDVTGDFKADATDAIFMRRYLLKKLTAEAEALDVTGDGIADIRDLVKLKKAIAGVA